MPGDASTRRVLYVAVGDVEEGASVEDLEERVARGYGVTAGKVASSAEVVAVVGRHAAAAWRNRGHVSTGETYGVDERRKVAPVLGASIPLRAEHLDVPALRRGVAVRDLLTAPGADEETTEEVLAAFDRGERGVTTRPGPLGSTLLPRTATTVDEARSRLAGLHFAKEALSREEREVLAIAEGLLRLLDDGAPDGLLR